MESGSGRRTTVNKGRVPAIAFRQSSANGGGIVTRHFRACIALQRFYIFCLSALIKSENSSAKAVQKVKKAIRCIPR